MLAHLKSQTLFPRAREEFNALKNILLPAKAENRASLATKVFNGFQSYYTSDRPMFVTKATTMSTWFHRIIKTGAMAPYPADA